MVGGHKRGRGARVPADVLRQARASVRGLRFAAGLTLRDLASRSGIHESALSRFESGKGGLLSSTLARIAEAFHTSPESLIGTPLEGASEGRAAYGQGQVACARGRYDGRIVRLVGPAPTSHPAEVLVLFHGTHSGEARGKDLFGAWTWYRARQQKEIDALFGAWTDRLAR